MFSRYTVLLLGIILQINANDDVVLELNSLGTLIGSQTQSAWTHQKIYQFLGIPFAESPSGLRRFKVCVEVQ